MTSLEVVSYQLDELVVVDHVDEAVFAALQKSLSGGESGVSVLFDTNGRVISKTDNAAVDAHAEINQSIRNYQRGRGGRIGPTVVYAEFVAYTSEHDVPWHGDVTDAFMASTIASIEGLRGTVPVADKLEAGRFVRREGLKDPHLSHIETVEIVQPPAGSLIHASPGAMHQSPATPEGYTGDDLRLRILSEMRHN